jgi:hypothetical protein
MSKERDQQVKIDLHDLTVALIKHKGIREGRWMLGFEFDMSAGNAGPSGPDARPTAFLRVTSALLHRQEGDSPPFPFVVDAAQVNPAGKKPAK